jgi:DNA-binding NarL/FixJ family response regulator
MGEPAGITVVIVEDHAMVAESLAAALSAEPDLTVVGIAGTVADGVDLVAAAQPDVVLMDLMLPDGDGAQATVEILRRVPETRVILLTAASGQDILGHAVEAGCVGMLSKTRPIADVRAAVRRAGAGEAVFEAGDLMGLVGRMHPQEEEPVDPLTARERDVLARLARGSSTEAIADDLVLSIHTVRNHVRNLMGKLGAHSRLEAVAVALRQGLIAVEPGSEAADGR